MMDLLLVAFPQPVTFPELEQRARVTAWGPEENAPWFWRGHPLGHAFPKPRADVSWATSRPGLPPTLATRMDTWGLLRVGPEAIASYRRLLCQVETPELDLGELLERLLLSQPEWVVWCERDVDQHPVDHGPMTPSEVLTQLRENVLGTPAQRDFVAWSAASEP